MICLFLYQYSTTFILYRYYHYDKHFSEEIPYIFVRVCRKHNNNFLEITVRELFSSESRDRAKVRLVHVTVYTCIRSEV